jgi:hypothetical protein
MKNSYPWRWRFHRGTLVEGSKKMVSMSDMCKKNHEYLDHSEICHEFILADLRDQNLMKS